MTVIFSSSCLQTPFIKIRQFFLFTVTPWNLDFSSKESGCIENVLLEKCWGNAWAQERSKETRKWRIRRSGWSMISTAHPKISRWLNEWCKDVRARKNCIKFVGWRRSSEKNPCGRLRPHGRIILKFSLENNIEVVDTTELVQGLLKTWK